MASLEIGPISNFLDEDEISAIHRALDDHDVELPDSETDDAHTVEGNLDEDVLAEFLDQLEANDAGCDVYLPAEFEDPFEAAGYRVGSAQALLLALNELRDDMGIGEGDDEPDLDDFDDDEEPDDDDFEDDDDGPLADEMGPLDLKEQQLRHLWQGFFRGANAAVARGLVLIVQS